MKILEVSLEIAIKFPKESNVLNRKGVVGLVDDGLIRSDTVMIICVFWLG